MFADLTHWYSTPITNLIYLPRRYLQTLIDNLPRVQAQWQSMLSEAALFPHISDKERKNQRSVWAQIIEGSKHIIKDIHEAILMGEVTLEEMEKLLPATSKVAHSFEEAVELFS